MLSKTKEEKMRILGIVSSPRRGGNSELAVKEILRAFTGEERVMINLNDLNISNCDACYSCVPKGKKCRIDDDLDFLIRNIKHSDKVVIAAPSYLLGVHTAVKRALDRLISLVADYPFFKHTDCVIVNPYGYTDWEGTAREELILFAKKLHLNVLAERTILATLPGDSVRGGNLEILRELAELLKTGAPDADAGMTQGNVCGRELLTCPHCGSSLLQIMPQGAVRCSICGSRMTLVKVCSGFDLEYDPGYSHHFTPESLDAHVDYLMEKKQLFLDTRHEVKALQDNYAADDEWWLKPSRK